MTVLSFVTRRSLLVRLARQFDPARDAADFDVVAAQVEPFLDSQAEPYWLNGRDDGDETGRQT